MKYAIVLSPGAAAAVAALAAELRAVVEGHLDRLAESPTRHSRPSVFPFLPNRQLSTFEHRDAAGELHCFNVQFRYGQVEIVSPANNDRPESRQLFIAKCANLLRQDVCVSLVDLVTARRFNLYTELLALLEHTDPSMSPDPPPVYAATCRKRQTGRKTKLDAWAVSLVLGQPLPPLYIWLTETFSVSLDLEATYEQTCRALQIG